jgi:hypothetical protein
MILKDFLSKNNVTSFEGIENVLMLSIIVNDSTYYMLDVDTSNIVSGTVLTKFSDFVVENDTVIVGGTIIDINKTNVI